ncbi:hypothetical protein [Amycolatopsis rifamycinica]|uniref:Uncharacterized protein n=1 Tax=Amycolatopsis rifamycinica TaxID=287986 RepID=A0A066TTJ6_9PSEU|nr:hypothetical protein [Amycolatopsis rifamycinica]KDN16892.1 hypothetical protein DV20_37950 [Amycolatopsis rifamycinica]
MGSSRRAWFPLAALGFALIVMVTVELVPDDIEASRGYQLTQGLHGLGTGGVGGTGLASEQRAVTAVAVDVVPPATLGWLAGLVSVVLAVAAWYWWQLRPPRPGRFLFGTLGALAAVPLLDLIGFLQLRLDGDVRGALLATFGLLLLAGYERSWFLAAVAGVFALVTTVFPTPVAAALVAAGVLFAAAFAVLLHPRPDGPAAAWPAPWTMDR